MYMLIKKIWGKIPDMVKLFLVVGLIITVIMVSACGTYFWKNYPQDNVIEEAVEDIIKHKTGLDLDLTPHSKEKAALQSKPLEWNDNLTPLTTNLWFVKKACEDEKNPTPKIQRLDRQNPNTT